MEAKHKNEEAKKAKKGQKGGEMVSLAPRAPSGHHFGRHNREAAPKGHPWAPFWAPWCPRGARGRHLGTNSAAKFSFREIRVSTPYISFLTPPKPLFKPHLHENKVAMLGFTQNPSNPLIPLPFP